MGFLPCLCFDWTIEEVTVVIEMVVSEQDDREVHKVSEEGSKC